MLKLTIGMPAWNNFTEVFFTVQALRMYHDMTDKEILVVDNFGDPELEKFIKNQGGNTVRYVKANEVNGPSYAKNKVFEHARGEMVLCIDSHVLLVKGALENLPSDDNLYQGPLMYCDIVNYTWEWTPVWRGNMWGIWGAYGAMLPKEPHEIWGMGCGCFMAKKATWLGFNPKCKGFGGAEEGIIHEKYRQAGRKVICLPQLAWMHQFDRKIPHPVILIDRVINYIINFRELKLDLKQIEEHFGKELYDQAVIEADKR